jgi:hypothetical protein
MSKGFKVVDGDVVVNRTIEIVRDDELLRQTVELVIGTNQGEWSYDLLEGINRSVVLCKNYDEDEIRTTIEEAVRRIDDTLTLTDFTLEVDARRHATISFKLLKSDGEELGVTYTYAD